MKVKGNIDAIRKFAAAAEILSTSALRALKYNTLEIILLAMVGANSSPVQISLPRLSIWKDLFRTAGTAFHFVT